MFCENCGREIKEESKFCPYCGCEIKNNSLNNELPTPMRCIAPMEVVSG